MVVFATPLLKHLHMKNCKLKNLELSDAQFTLLDQLTTFDATITVTECADGFRMRNLHASKVYLAVAHSPAS